MTEKQRVFAENYAKSGDGEKSAALAGYAKNHSSYAQRLLGNPEISEYIKKIAEKDSSGSVLSAGQCREVLSSIVSNEGNTPSERMKAIDLLMEIGEEVKGGGDIHISVSYGGTDEI